jgi:hypothetical protein
MPSLLAIAVGQAPWHHFGENVGQRLEVPPRTCGASVEPIPQGIAQYPVVE